MIRQMVPEAQTPQEAMNWRRSRQFSCSAAFRFIRINPLIDCTEQMPAQDLLGLEVNMLESAAAQPALPCLDDGSIFRVNVPRRGHHVLPCEALGGAVILADPVQSND